MKFHCGSSDGVGLQGSASLNFMVVVAVMVSDCKVRAP